MLDAEPPTDEMNYRFLVAFFALTGVSLPQAQAPAHTALVTGETAYIYNISDYAEASDLLFEQLQRWRRYRVINDPRQADLIFVIEVTTNSAGSLALQTGPTTTQGRAWVDVAGRIQFSSQAYTPPSVAIPLTTTRAFVYVFARTQSGELILVWRDSEPVGLRKSKTAEKVVDRLRSQVASTPRTSTTTRAAIQPSGSGGRGAGVISAGALPPLTPTVRAPTKVEESASWTTRSQETVRYQWSVTIVNENKRTLDAIANVLSWSTDERVVHITRGRGSVGAGASTTISGENELPTVDAQRVAHWTIDVIWSNGDEIAAPVDAMEAPVPAAMSAGSEIVPVPLTDSMVQPQLVPASVTFALSDPRLRDIDLAGKQITIRCLIRDDGTVADAKVFRIAPAVPTAIETVLEEAIRASAIRSWYFSPARRDGVAVPVWDLVTVESTGGS